MHRSMNSRFACVFMSLALLCGLAGAQQKPAAAKTAAKPKSEAVLPSEETVNAFLHEMFGYDSSISSKVVSIRPAEAEGLAEVTIVISGAQGSQTNKIYVTPDGRHALSGDILPFGAHPFETARRELAKDATGPARGPADAPVTIVEFSDLQCPHCKDAQPVINKLMTEAKNVRLVFQNFPLPMHDWAAKAAAYADCVGRESNDGFWKFIESVYGAQSDITAANADEKLTGFADAAGVKGADTAACAAKPESTDRVERSSTLARAQDVTSTPTLFINGRKVGGAAPYEVLQKLVDFAAKEPK